MRNEKLTLEFMVECYNDFLSDISPLRPMIDFHQFVIDETEGEYSVEMIETPDGWDGYLVNNKTGERT